MNARRVRLEWAEQTYWMQAAQTFAQLRDAQTQVSFSGYVVALRDEAEFAQWVGAQGPGKIRLIQRADGVEVQTAVGKVPGPDPEGPTLPARAGSLSHPSLQKVLVMLRERFGAEDGIWIVPSFGMPLSAVLSVVRTIGELPKESRFPYTALVFPRPPPQAAGYPSTGR
ncbi:MAG: hypothetical protein ACKVPX_11870 [Myxococcaceae bacterium]